MEEEIKKHSKKIYKTAKSQKHTTGEKVKEIIIEIIVTVVISIEINIETLY